MKGDLFKEAGADEENISPAARVQRAGSAGHKLFPAYIAGVLAFAVPS
jgi:hypothetical protein